MKPPPPPDTTLATAQDIDRAMTNSFRARKGQLRIAEFAKNIEFRDMGLEVAKIMVGHIKSQESTFEEKVRAAKAFSEIVKSHTLLQSKTLQIAESDMTDDVPPPQQRQAPPPPIMISAPGATFHSFPQESLA